MLLRECGEEEIGFEDAALAGLVEEAGAHRVVAFAVAAEGFDFELCGVGMGDVGDLADAEFAAWGVAEGAREAGASGGGALGVVRIRGGGGVDVRRVEAGDGGDELRGWVVGTDFGHARLAGAGGRVGISEGGVGGFGELVLAVADVVGAGGLGGGGFLLGAGAGFLRGFFGEGLGRAREAAG